MRDLLPLRPSLRVILMSATLHVDLFHGYFGRYPHLHIPGFTYPVTYVGVARFTKDIRSEFHGLTPYARMLSPNTPRIRCF